MITLSNGHSFEYMVASGALGFDGKGWWWEKPLVVAGIMRPELFTIVLRTLTWESRLYPKSNLSWIRPWTWLPWSSRSCVQFIPGGAINKVGLWNPGLPAWSLNIAPKIEFDRLNVVSSIFGTKDELVRMAFFLNTPAYKIKALELNVSCPSTGHMDVAKQIVESVEAVKKVSQHPLILKLSVDQADSFRQIADGVCGKIEAFSLNSVPYKIVFPHKTSPLEKIGESGTGGGGVSGRPAQEKNWKALSLLVNWGHTIPVIAPSIMGYEDLEKVRRLGAEAVSFGAIHLRTPWKPTEYVLREMAENKAILDQVFT